MTDRREFNQWFVRTYADPDHRFTHLPSWFKNDIWEAWQAGRALAPSAQAVPDMEAEAVEPVGWTQPDFAEKLKRIGIAYICAEKTEDRADFVPLFASPPKPEGIVEALREALKPFAKIADMAPDGSNVIVNISRCRDARRALEALAARSLASRRAE
ncbi:MAG: hypothetical protein EOS10_00310 [Mesorhizobium sp.]|uniref:hypothetical protein n=1 Tax=Mesorhizobium sp. TaxID=1871066 RepID=UPI000FE7DEDF|nr:hypothetical protein [Mesorhizobium sp.]RWO34781.1 MAG: hypothetical protein EOS10_00310 [Mesorhizobium sp.]